VTRKRMRTALTVKQAALRLRKQMTPAERLLWERLRDRRAAGFKFRRQHAIGPYVVDFYCAERRLVIEVDGGIHRATRQADAGRTMMLEERGCKVLRFANDQVLGETDSVVESILEVAHSLG